MDEESGEAASPLSVLLGAGGPWRGGHPAAGVLSGIAQGLLDALRIARFHTSNEFTDWDTALHTFTFANAVHQGLRRAPSAELLRGVFDAAISVYLDRFFNVPPAHLPEPDDEPIEECGRAAGVGAATAGPSATGQ